MSNQGIVQCLKGFHMIHRCLPQLDHEGLVVAHMWHSATSELTKVQIGQTQSLDIDAGTDAFAPAPPSPAPLSHMIRAAAERRLFSTLIGSPSLFQS